MTIGVGFSADDGIGLLTDSMWNFGTETGQFTPIPGSRSPHRLASVRAVAVVSGNPSRDPDTVCAGIAAETVESAAGQLFRQMEADERELRGSWPVYDTLNLGKDGNAPEVLVAGGKDGASLRLGVLTPRTQQWFPSGERAFVVIGAWTRYFEALDLLRRPHPGTLEGCLERVIKWAHEYITGIYAGRSLEEMVAEGATPTVGYALHAVIFDRSGAMREHRIEEPTALTVEVRP